MRHYEISCQEKGLGGNMQHIIKNHYLPNRHDAQHKLGFIMFAMI